MMRNRKNELNVRDGQEISRLNEKPSNIVIFMSLALEKHDNVLRVADEEEIVKNSFDVLPSFQQSWNLDFSFLGKYFFNLENQTLLDAQDNILISSELKQVAENIENFKLQGSGFDENSIIVDDGEDEDSEVELNLIDLENSLIQLQKSLEILQGNDEEPETQPVEIPTEPKKNETNKQDVEQEIKGSFQGDILSDSFEIGEAMKEVPKSLDESLIITPKDGLNGFFDGHDVRLYPQVTLPQKRKPSFQVLNAEKNFWPVQLRLKKLGWNLAQKAHPSTVNLFFTKGKIPPFLLKKYSNTSTAYKVYNNKIINSIGLSGCIGGQKSLQLSCRQKLASVHGCDYSELKIQPVQVVLDNKDACISFFETHVESKKDYELKQWLYKPRNTFHGAGIRLYTGRKELLELKKKFYGCKKFNRYNDGVIMEYISKPATIKSGFKFDFRSYLLVASTNPLLVFYHDGFVRKADVVYNPNESNKNAHITNAIGQSTKDHFFNFDQLSELLFNEPGSKFPKNFMTLKRPYLKKVTRFMFETIRTQENKIRKKNGRFHLFGVDWIVDSDQNIHLLEGNGFPLVSHYPGIDLTPKIWNDMTDLVLRIHTKPNELSSKLTVRSNYQYNGWHLVYNELEDMFNKKHGDEYSVCETFPAN
eukprot:maker-scaffold_1-snap-gene-13.39-mRNA-1 protein AED:0.04 eAED:0.04 QI:81/0/0.5/1/1/1/2/0/645